MTHPFDIIDRLHGEASELNERLLKLTMFIMSESYRSLPERQRFLLAQQQLVMRQYHDLLALRIDDLVASPSR